MSNYIKNRLKSFYWAFKGIFDLFSHHPNAQIHLLITCITIPLCFYLQINIIEWCLIILSISIVIALEALNSAIEYLADKITLEYNPLIGKAKDIAAAAVLIGAIGAVIIGSLILLPKLVLVGNAS